MGSDRHNQEAGHGRPAYHRTDPDSNSGAANASSRSVNRDDGGEVMRRDTLRTASADHVRHAARASA